MPTQSSEMLKPTNFLAISLTFYKSLHRMKSHQRILLLLSLFGAQAVQAQNTLQLNLQYVLNGAPLQFQSSVDVFGTNLEIDRLQYDVSDFVITHDGGRICRRGTVTQSTDVWNTRDLLSGLYLLVGLGPALFQQRLIIQ